MITNDPVTGTPMPTTVEQLEAMTAPAAGFPDPALLAQMANEMFRALPTAAHHVPGNAVLRTPVDSEAQSLVAPTVSAANSVATASAAPQLPGHSLPGIAPVLQYASAPTVAAMIPNATTQTPGLPGGFSPASYATVPSFSFLDEARSIFTSPPAMPVQAVALPGTSVVFPTTAMPASIPGATQQDLTPFTDVSKPLIPGAITQPLAFDPGLEFGFLNELKPLDPISAVPALSPVESNHLQPGLVNLSSIPFDVAAIRRDFPILQERVNGRPLIWLDNAATTQKPQSVIDRLAYFYAHENSNIHRAAHTLAARATDAYEAARETTRQFLNASSTGEIIFVRGATEAINLVAQSWGRRHIQKDDEVVVTHLEHHANIVPWQMLCAEKGARLRVAPVDNSGQILLDEYEKLLNSKTKLVAVAHVSNALGTVVPVHEMVEAAHRHGAKVLVDGAQAVSHMAVDVQTIGCDFYVFSGHKVFAPTGIGVVYGRQDVLEQTPPWQGGGNMISDVTFEKTLYQPPPGRFEAGTGNIADAVGLGAALDYVQRIGMPNIARYEHDLLVYGTKALSTIPGLHLVGTAADKASVLSFVLDGFRTEDVGAALNQEGIAVRSGHHCAQPILRRFGLEATVRPSLAFYNTCEEIDALVAAIWNIKNGRNSGMR